MNLDHPRPSKSKLLAPFFWILILTSFRPSKSKLLANLFSDSQISNFDFFFDFTVYVPRISLDFPGVLL